MRDEGYAVKWRGKSLEFKNGEQERFTRSYRLGEDYTEEALRQRVGKSLLKQTERKNEAAKRAFDAWPEKPIPKTAQLSEEFAALLKEKKACYSKYRAARKEMIEYQNAKQNVDRLLGITRLQEKPREKEHGFINEKINRELS